MLSGANSEWSWWRVGSRKDLEGRLWAKCKNVSFVLNDCVLEASEWDGVEVKVRNDEELEGPMLGMIGWVNWWLLILKG
jgi:hypothetical protein